MPTVPTYGNDQVRTQALPGARLTDPGTNPGAAVGAGLAKLGAGIQDVYLAEQKRQSEIAVLEADRKLSSWQIEALHNPQTGVLNRRGKDAFGVPDEVLPEFDKQVETLGKDLTNDAQRQAFRRLASGRRLETEQAVVRHVSAEMRKFEDNELDAYIKNAHDAALANPELAGNEVERQRLAIQSYAARNGMGPEWFKLKFGEAASRTHLGVMEGLLARGDDLRAGAYYKKHGAALLGEDRTRAEKALDVGTLRGSSQREADRITTEYHDPAAMIAAVEQIKDPKLRDATEERVQRKIRFLVETNQRANDRAFSDAWSVVEQTGNTDNVPPAVWGALPPQRRAALKQYAKRVSQGDDVPNNNEKWLEFLNMPEQKLLKLTEAELLTDYLPNFDRAHRERAMTRWGNARDSINGNPSAKEKHANTQTFHELVSDALVKSGIGLKLGHTKSDLKKLPEDRQRAIIDFENEADRAIKRFETTKLLGKRAATSEEMQQVIDGLLIKRVFVSNRFLPGGEERPTALLTEAERGRVKVPDEERVKIKAALARAGRAASEEEILRLYKQKSGLQ